MMGNKVWIWVIIGDFLFLGGGLLLLDTWFPIIDDTDGLRNTGIILGLVGTIMGIGLVSNMIINHFHPLYALCHIGYNIQNLDARIAEQIAGLQMIFATNIPDFSQLQTSLELLSQTYGKIIFYFAKLESIDDKKLDDNFDGQYYISSLHGDIKTILHSLLNLLRGQDQLLTEKYQILQKLHREANEGEENVELAQMRTSNIQELLRIEISKIENILVKI